MATASSVKGRIGRRGKTREEKAAEAAALRARLEEFAESLDPAERAVYEGRFDRYSSRNALMIVMQDPEATVVAGYREWQARGRQVRKGEMGIRIVSTGILREQESDDDERRYFFLTSVFDVRQTDPIEE